MYKNKEKQREAVRKAVQKHRQGITSSIEGITSEDLKDLLYNKLTDKKKWRPVLEKICHTFGGSHHPSYSDMCFLGNYELPLVCDLLEVTR